MIKQSLLILLAASMVSCLELPDMSNHDGPQTSFQEIGNAVLNAWGTDDKFDGAKINMNESVYLSKTFEVMGSAPKEYEALSLTTHAVLDGVVDQDGNPARDFRMIYVSTARTDSNQKPFPTEISYILTKSMSPSPTSLSLIEGSATAVAHDAEVPQYLKTFSDVHQYSNSNPPLSVHNMVSAIYNCKAEPSEGWNPTCYNLRSWTTVEPAPYFMQTAPNCGGLANCQMNVTHVAYDLVTDVTDEDTGSRNRAKTLIEIQISRDLPYLSRVSNMCFQGLGKYQGTPYVAKVCTEVTKFERGTAR